jgi:hypothetical protein
MTTDQEAELERQVQCVVTRIRALAAKKAKGGLTIHFDGSGLLGLHFTEHLTLCRDDFSPVKVGRKIDDEELKTILDKRDQTIIRSRKGPEN